MVAFSFSIDHSAINCVWWYSSLEFLIEQVAKVNWSQVEKKSKLRKKHGFYLLSHIGTITVFKIAEAKQCFYKKKLSTYFTVHEVERVEHDLATKSLPPYYTQIPWD